MRRPRTQPAARRRALPRTAWIGSLCVLALVVASPAALALVPVEAFHGDGGAGAGAGDLSAAALQALDRDLQTSRALPPRARAARTPFVPLAPAAPLLAPATSIEGCGRVLAPPCATWRTGAREARHPLRR